MDLIPVGERILVKAEDVKEEIRNGIIMPKTQEERMQVTEVLAVGDKIEKIKAGDKVLFDKYGGSEVLYKGEKYLMLDLKFILAVIKEKICPACVG